MIATQPIPVSVIVLTHNEAVDDTQPDWSPNGRAIAFTSTAAGNGDIWVMDARGDDARRLTDDPALDERAAWQPHRDRHGHDHDDD